MTTDIVILYTNVVSQSDPESPPPNYYAEPTRRFFDTYHEFKPVIPHRLGVINCGINKGDSFNSYPADEQYFYSGTGWDIGAFQHIGMTLNCDLVVCFNSFAYFWRTHWLEYLVEAYVKHGNGVYGFTASFENSPHLRSQSFCFSPEVMKRYPHIIDNRSKTWFFEAGQLNFSLWALANWYPVILVTADGMWRIQNWRTPPNIFRRGDQSNCLVWDRHTDIYANASPSEKQKLEDLADGPKI